MALTRDFKETIKKRVECDPDFAKSLLHEAVDLMLDGDSAATHVKPCLVERERQRQSLVHSLKGKFSDMKFSSEDLIKQRQAETLLEGH